MKDARKKETKLMKNMKIDIMKEKKHLVIIIINMMMMIIIMMIINAEKEFAKELENIQVCGLNP